MRFLIILLLLASSVCAQMPSHLTVAEAFFRKYSVPEDYRQALVFAKKKSGWFAQVIDRRTDSVLLARPFWSAGNYLPLTGFGKAEPGTLARERAKQFINEPSSYSRYGYERCRYYGYPDWANDLIRDYGGRNPASLTDTLLEGLARAYSAKATTFLHNRFGGLASSLPNLDPLALPERHRIDSALPYLEKSLRCYEDLAKRNPGYSTIVGNSVAKLVNEYTFAWMELEMAGDSTAARRFLEKMPDRPEVSAYARNYLLALPPRSILFTYGDDDTYPLLWEQKAHQTRTDVTIINMSLLGLARYIDGLKKNGLQFSAEPSYYGDPDHLFASKVLGAKNRASLSELLHALYAGKEARETEDGKFYLYNVEQISWPVTQRFASLAGGIRFADSVSLELPGYLTLDQILLLDILQTNLYERPLFFTSVEQLLSQQMVALGSLYQFLPAVDNWGVEDPSLVHSRDSTYLAHFSAVSFDPAKGQARFDRDPSVYYLFSQVDAALQNGDKETAVRLLNRISTMYGNRLAYDRPAQSFVQLYLKAGLLKAGTELANHYAADAQRLYEKPSATDYLVMEKGKLKAFLFSLAQDIQAAGGDASRIRQLAKKYESK